MVHAKWAALQPGRRIDPKFAAQETVGLKGKLQKSAAVLQEELALRQQVLPDWFYPLPTKLAAQDLAAAWLGCQGLCWLR